MRGTLSILVAALLWAVPSHAQLGHPEVEDVYGGRIRWIDTAILDGHTTRVFISTESANSLFYTDIDHGAGIGTFTRFTAVADADTSDGFGPGVSRFAALDGSGWVYFIHNGTLYGADTDAGSRTTVAGPGVQGVLDSGGMLFYLMEAGGSLTLHFGVVDSADGSFSEDAGSPVAVGPGAPAPNGYTLAVDPVGDTLRFEAKAKGGALWWRGEGAWYHKGLHFWVCSGAGVFGCSKVPRLQVFNVVWVLLLLGRLALFLGP